VAHWIVRRRTLLAPSAGAIREVQRSVSYARAVVLDEARAHETFWSVQSLPSLCDTLLDQRFGHALENIRISDVRVCVVLNQILSKPDSCLSATRVSPHKTMFLHVCSFASKRWRKPPKTC